MAEGEEEVTPEEGAEGAEPAEGAEEPKKKGPKSLDDPKTPPPKCSGGEKRSQALIRCMGPCRTPGTARPTAIFKCMQGKRGEFAGHPQAAPPDQQMALANVDTRGSDHYPPQGGLLTKTCGVKAQFVGEIIIKKEIPPRKADCSAKTCPNEPGPQPPDPCAPPSPKAIQQRSVSPTHHHQAPICAIPPAPVQPEISDECRRVLNKVGPDSSRYHPDCGKCPMAADSCCQPCQPCEPCYHPCDPCYQPCDPCYQPCDPCYQPCDPCYQPCYTPCYTSCSPNYAPCSPDCTPCPCSPERHLSAGEEEKYETIRTREEILLDPCQQQCNPMLQHVADDQCAKYVKVEDTFRRTRSLNPSPDCPPPPIIRCTNVRPCVPCLESPPRCYVPPPCEPCTPCYTSYPCEPCTPCPPCPPCQPCFQPCASPCGPCYSPTPCAQPCSPCPAPCPPPCPPQPSNPPTRCSETPPTCSNRYVDPQCYDAACPPEWAKQVMYDPCRDGYEPYKLKPPCINDPYEPSVEPEELRQYQPNVEIAACNN